MSKRTAFLGKKLRLGPLWAFLLVAAASVLLTWAMLAIAPGKLADFVHLSGEAGYTTLILNFLPVLLVCMLLFFATGSAAVSVSVTGFVVLLMAVTNRLKIQLRGDPLLHWDLSLFGEVLGIVRGFGLGPILVGTLAIALYAGAAWLLCAKVKTGKMPSVSRALLTLACAAAMVGCNQTFYSNETLYDALPIRGNLYNLADVHNSKGSLYSFIINLNVRDALKPPEYDAQRVKKRADALGKTDPGKAAGSGRPNIIMIMGEAFSGLSESDAVDFDGYTDPLAAFKALGEDGIAGDLIVPSRGGGTADTEFDVLTGCASRYLRSLPYSYRMISRPVEALPSLLARLGYGTFSLHPGYTWFYNRQNVYRNLGFEERVFEDTFPEEAYDGAFITEEATFDRLLAMIGERLAEKPEEPMFGFCLTIQNHAAYKDRFLPKGTVNFHTQAALTDDETSELANYFEGIRQADVQLARLAAYLDGLDEPFVLVYYGDHLPALSDNLYNALIPGADAEAGSLVSETRLHTIPFIVWQNRAAKETGTIDRSAASVLLPGNGTISSNYLGAYLLETLGFGDISPFFRYVNALRASFPVLLEGGSYDGNGALADGDPTVSGDGVSPGFYREWVYYRMMAE